MKSTKKYLFKIGDKIKIIRSGACWTGYKAKFKELGIEFPEENHPPRKEGEEGVIFNACMRGGIKEQMLAIRFEDGKECLYSWEGVQLVERILENYEIF